MARQGFSVQFAMLAVILTQLTAQPSWSARLVAEDAKLSWPVSARPGETAPLERPELVDARQVWTSFGATLEGATPDRKVARLKLPADAPLGVGVAWLGMPKGAPEPLLLVVDELPVVTKRRGNSTLEKAQVLELPVAVDGFVDSRQSDFYRCALRAGDSLSIEVFAARLTSRLDPKIRLLEPTGRELAFVDDSPGLGGDCRLRYTAPGDGPVVLELSDIGYDGGRGYFYHLRMGDFPLINALFPPVARPGTEVKWEATGEAVGGLLPQTTIPSPGLCEAPLRVAVRFAEDKPAAFGELVPVETAPLLESEPNDAAEQANAIEPQCTVAGQFGKPRDRDVYQFAVQKNQRYRVAAEMRRFGSPGDLYLRAESLRGDLLAESDNLKPDEVELEFAAREDGAARLIVEELNLCGGLGQVYLFEIAPVEQCFDLHATGDSFSAAKGASFTVRVASKRRPGNEPITLELADFAGRALAADWKLADNVIAKDKNETQLKVTVPAEALPGSIQMARIVGRCRRQDIDYSAIAVQSPIVGKSPLAALARYPNALRGAIAIGVEP